MKKQLLFAVILGLAALNLNAQTRVSKTIEMLNFVNKAVIDANQAKGGLHTVADAAARKAIKSSRLVNGMLVSQVDDGSIWRLVNAGSPGADASWVELGVLPTWVKTTAYSTYDMVLHNGKFYLWQVANGTSGATFTAGNWRELGKTRVRQVGNVSLLPTVGVVSGDVTIVVDVEGTLTGSQYGTYIYDETIGDSDPKKNWRQQSRQSFVRTVADAAAFGALTVGDYSSGDVVIVTDNDAASPGNQQGSYIHNGNAFVLIHEEEYTTTKGIVYSGVSTETAIGGLDETKVKALANKPADKSRISDASNVAVAAAVTAASYYVLAYPEDWTGAPVFTLDYDGAKSVLTDCFTKTTLDIDSRKYIVYHCDINLADVDKDVTISVK